MQIDNYTPRTMSEPVEKRMPVTTFFRDTFFPDVETFVTEHVEMDFSKGGYSVAPFVANNVGGINMGREGYQTKMYTPPRVAPQRPMNKAVLQSRLPGENLHTTTSPEERQDYYLEKDAQDLDDSISRREEIMCGQLITNGTVNVRGYIDDDKSKYIDDDINYQFTQKTVLSTGSKWNESTSKKYDDLEAGVEKVLQAGYNARYCILGQLAYKEFRNDEKIQKLLDTRRMEMGLIAPKMMTQNGNGLLYVGNLPGLGIELWAYYAWYKDYDGIIKPIMPTNTVVITPDVIGKMNYGAITQLEEDKRYHTYEGTRVPKMIADLDGDVLKYRLSSRPIPKPFDVDSWVSMEVL